MCDNSTPSFLGTESFFSTVGSRGFFFLSLLRELKTLDSSALVPYLSGFSDIPYFFLKIEFTSFILLSLFIENGKYLSAKSLSVNLSLCLCGSKDLAFKSLIYDSSIFLVGKPTSSFCAPLGLIKDGSNFLFTFSEIFMFILPMILLI